MIAPLQKHIIFLGAGASFTSGLPLAEHLTLLMCDRDYFISKLQDRIPNHWQDPQKLYIEKIVKYYDSFAGTAELLRHGGFGTMDELSFFAREGIKSAEIRKLKKLMRLCLGLHNKEFARSDYRAFVNWLFSGARQRPDEQVIVISFNYDPVLEYRLIRALKTRSALKPNDSLILDAQCCASGFLDVTNLEWLDENDRFAVLKLHGMCSFLNMEHRSWNYETEAGVPFTDSHFMADVVLGRLLLMTKEDVANQDPPTILPWEIIDENGKLRSQESFTTHMGNDWQHVSLYPLFSGIWRRASFEVLNANKLSFIGLSLSDYLVPGFKYLFGGTYSGDYELGFANKESTPDNYTQARTPSGRFLDFMAEFRPGVSLSVLEENIQPTFGDFMRNCL